MIEQGLVSYLLTTQAVATLLGGGQLAAGLATGGSSTTLADTTQTWSVNQFQFGFVTITAGTGKGQSAQIASNTATVLTLGTTLAKLPDGTSAYAIFGPGRFWPNRMPQRKPQATQASQYPAVVFSLIDVVRKKTLTQATGMSVARLTLANYGLAYAPVKNLAEQERLALDGFQGYLGGFTVPSVRIDNERDEYTQPFAADEVGIYGTHVDVLITFYETVTLGHS